MDNLGTFLPADVEQPHGGDAPAIPPLNKLFRTDQDIDLTVRLVDVAEEAFGEDIFGFCDDAGIVGFNQFFEVRSVADVDEPKVVTTIGGFQSDFALGVADIAEMQCTA